MPQVSIVIPIYNVEKYISENLDSVRTQDFTDFELILVDDGSTDGSGKICDRYAEEDSRIKVLHVENGGVGRARNIGINIASGKYIIFSDSDDICRPNYISSLIGCSEEDALVISGLQYFKDENFGKIINHSKKAISVQNYISEILSKDNISQFCGGPYCKLFSKDILTKTHLRFEEDSSYAEDFCFNMKYLFYIKKVVITGDVTYLYRDGVSGSLSRDFSKFDFWKYWNRYLDVYHIFRNVFVKYNLYARFQDDVEFLYKYYILRIIRQNVLYVKDYHIRNDNLKKLMDAYPLKVKNLNYRMTKSNQIILSLYKKRKTSFLNFFVLIKTNIVNKIANGED